MARTECTILCSSTSESGNGKERLGLPMSPDPRALYLFSAVPWKSSSSPDCSCLPPAEVRASSVSAACARSHRRRPTSRLLETAYPPRSIAPPHFRTAQFSFLDRMSLSSIPMIALIQIRSSWRAAHAHERGLGCCAHWACAVTRSSARTPIPEFRVIGPCPSLRDPPERIKTFG